ncbi:ephrin type-B receptor 1-B-like [Paramuricea clavata]|uniref:Ephrin type-B receptor 1-B-like n=1 Tax=Paramuricea clavata TaxID=317549 RepID=A0A7D9KVK7_PARCT|nr:ephrin type-B receptor 1-B-like [Paramuricea clavata]
MSRTFLPVLCYILFVSIVIPGISHALNETIESGNMKDMFRAPFRLAGNGNTWRKVEKDGYVESCSEGGNFGFITKQINIKDAFADVIYVAIETSFSTENIYNNSLGIYLYNGMAQPPATNQKPAIGHFFLQNFSLIYILKNSTASARNGVKWTHIFKFHKNYSSKIILAVKGVGVCARVYSMKVYYYYCGEKYSKGVRFPKTVSPFEGWKKVEANCSLNSSPSDQRKTTSGFCGHHGTWNISMGMGCFCKKGFEQNSLKNCTPCPSGQFKPKSSNESCQTCPNKSNNTVDRTSCKCMEGYFHSTPKAVPTTAPCFGPITEKLKMRINKFPNKTVKLTWNAVKVDEEIRYSLHYDVQCFMCDREGRKCHMACENARYQPRQNNVTETFVDVSNLHPDHRYKFRVYPKTVINRFIGRVNWSYSETELFQVQVEGT